MNILLQMINIHIITTYPAYWEPHWPAVHHQGVQPHRWALLLCSGLWWQYQAPAGCSGCRFHPTPVCGQLLCLIPNIWSSHWHLCTASSVSERGEQSQMHHTEQLIFGQAQWEAMGMGGWRGMEALNREDKEYVIGLILKFFNFLGNGNTTVK